MPKCNEKIYPLAAREKGTKNIEKGKELTCPKCENKFNAPYDIRQALAYKQLIKNIYKTNISIDLANIGVEEVPKIDNESDSKIMDGIELTSNIEYEDKIERIKAILNGIYNLSDFANQSREMVNASPDFVIIGLQKQYNHRLASVLKMDEDGNINTTHMESVISDVLATEGNIIFIGYIKGVITNEEDVFNSLDSLKDEYDGNLVVCTNPRKSFDNAIASLSGDQNESP